MDLSLTIVYLLQRILIPLTLATAVILRQNLLSAIYLILLLIAPILPSPTSENVLNGINGIYLKIIIILSSLANFAHIITQIILLVAFNYTTSIDNCSWTGQLLNLIGLYRLNEVSFFNILRLCCLDFIVLLISCLIYVFSTRTYHSKQLLLRNSRDNLDNRLGGQHLERRFTLISYQQPQSHQQQQQNASGDTGSNTGGGGTGGGGTVATTRFMSQQSQQPLIIQQQSYPTSNKRQQKKDKAQRLSYYITEGLFFLLLCASAIIEPSLISAIYFLYFLFIGSWFALDRSFGSGYHYFRIFIALFVGLHFSLIFFYQFLLVRPLMPPDNINSRLFGLIEYTKANCTNVRDFELSDFHFVRFLHPLVLLLLYFVSINLIRTVLINKKISKNQNPYNYPYYYNEFYDDNSVDKSYQQQQQQQQLSTAIYHHQNQYRTISNRNFTRFNNNRNNNKFKNGIMNYSYNSNNNNRNNNIDDDDNFDDNIRRPLLLSQSLYMNSVYDPNNLANNRQMTNDHTPLLHGQNRTHRSYSTVIERSQSENDQHPHHSHSQSHHHPHPHSHHSRPHHGSIFFMDGQHPHHQRRRHGSLVSNIHSNISTSLPPTATTTSSTAATTPNQTQTSNPLSGIGSGSGAGGGGGGGNVHKSSASARDNNQFSLFCFQLICMVKRASYVITLIVMMTWSITYHSWLSFILLLSSCIIWMTPNSRQTCLNSSPILVFYALLLVIGQYIYSLNLNEKELPEKIGQISISEIGFKKYGEYSYQPLFIKIFYTMFFWITLRQYTESLKEEVQPLIVGSTLDLAAAGTASLPSPGILSPLFNLGPRALSQQTATTIGHSSQSQIDFDQQFFIISSPQSKIFDSMIKWFKEILIKYWIWIVAIMLMVMSLSGTKVVIYRIVYMFLFLVFTTLFLISLKWWRKLIYPFWLVVILYSMIILIAIYTYQFNYFPDYWEKYLFIDKELQEDLGLVVYDNDAFVLFKELLTPTFFIIITIIQVHFVHKDFLEFSNIDEILTRLQTSSSNDYSIDISDGTGGGDAGCRADVGPSPSDGGRAGGGGLSSKNSLDPSLEQIDGSDLRSQPSQSELSVQTVISKNLIKNNARNAFDSDVEFDAAKPLETTDKTDNENDDKFDNSKLTESKTSLQTTTVKKPTFIQEIYELIIKCWIYMKKFTKGWMVIFWRLLEVHIMKLVFLCAILIAIRDISIMNVVYIFLSIFLMIFSPKFENIICFIFAIWSGILVLLKMLFQLNIAQRMEWHTNCTFDFNQTEVDNRAYIGFLKTDDIFSYIWEYIFLIIVLVFRVVIILRQYLYRSYEYGDRPLLPGVIFPYVDRTVADKDFKNFLKYLLNYGFYKFGVEICLILITISIGNHGDIFSVLYCICLIAFVLFNRQECQKYWAYFVGFMAIVLPYQYLMCLGIPPGLCLQYPWKNIPHSDLEWYYLPDFENQLPKNKLYLDFLLFFFLCRQLLYFRLEPKLIKHGGSNIEAYKELMPENVFDFFSFGTSIFDAFKSYFLFCFFWITLAVLFLAGTTRINLFGLGYVLGSFIFLWNGNEFYLKPIKMIFKSWKIIIGYTCMTMLLKSIIQVFVLTLLRHDICWLVQLMGITYHQKNDSIDPKTKELLQKCPTTEAGLLWDGICFTFLLIQKRIFCSHYFKYLIREIKAQHFLASRGAELIHEIQAQEVSEQEIAEKEVMEKIKQKMDRIKEAQQKLFANRARSIKYHKQDDYDYDISPYSDHVVDDGTLSQASGVDDLLFTQTLPTVYSPTPSIPTITSPQSATTLQPGYFEVYNVWPIRPIDASSSSATFASFSLASNVDHQQQQQQQQPLIQTQMKSKNVVKETTPTSATTSKLKDISIPVPFTAGSISRRHSTVSTLSSRPFPFISRRKTSHASSVKSGGYYMFEDAETEICDLSYRTRESLVPDPEGDEIKNLARSKGFTAFCSKIFKGEEPSEVALVSAEATTDVGESSRDSAIVSVERPKYNPDASLQTTLTTVPPTGQETDNSNISSLTSGKDEMPMIDDGIVGDDGRIISSSPCENIQMKVPTQPINVTEQQQQPQQEPTYLEKIKSWFDFIKKFAESIFISSTSNLNSVSRDYRFVAKRLTMEKKCLKKIIEIKELEGIRHDFISDQTWKKNTLAKLSKLTEENLETVSKSDPKNVLNVWKQLDLETSTEGNKHLYLVSLDSRYMETSIYIHFFRAIFYAILSRSEVICYITIVINQITSASILSLPLPLLAFLWGSLSVPRPSKSFWVTCITYIEIVVVLKYVFQFQFWPWNEFIKTTPFWWPRLLGIEKKDNYANYDLILLLVLFFHRFMLKSLGLWDLSETEIKAYMTNAELFQSSRADEQQQQQLQLDLEKQQQQQQPEDNLQIAENNQQVVGTLKSSSGKLKKSKKSSSKSKQSGNKLKQISSYENVQQQQKKSGNNSGGENVVDNNNDNDSGGSAGSAPGPGPAAAGAVGTLVFQDLNDEEGMIIINENDLAKIVNDDPNVDDVEDDDDEINFVYLLMETPTKVKKRFLSIVKPIYKFFHNVLHPPYRITHDVYSLMFLCDFINFFILVFGFYAFGSGYSGSEDVARFLEENKIPIGFLITLLIQFTQIIVDRAIYLRKYIKGKLIFQIIIVIFTHMWLFFVLPAMTDKSFTDKTNLPPKLWYIFKCIYFLLSAFQIRSGYPTRILGNTFCKKYNFVNWYLFKVYMIIPFVYDLRMYMDWIWTDTSLVLDEWSLMEDIFVNLYQRKCELKLDEEFPEPRGKAKKRFFKYLIGGSWVVIIIALIWGPLVLFAFGRAVGEVNPPIGATFELEIGGYQPLFKMSVTDSGLVPISEQKWSKLMSSFLRNPVAQTFISGYDRQDVYIVNLNGNSTAVWGISPPSQKILQNELRSNHTNLNMKLTYYLIRKKTKTQDMDTTIYDEHFIELKDQNLRKQLAEMISNSEEQNPAVIPMIFPNYLRAPEKGKPIVVTELLQKPANKTMNFRNLLILLKKGTYSNTSDSSITSWWEIHDDCSNNKYLDDFFRDLMATENCQFLPVLVFNDKVFIGLLAFLSGYGIIGIYTTFVFLVSRWVRGLNSESSFKVIYTRMPNVDRVLQLCLDIYLVRESREFELEEDLYAKLIFLYRSPETLIKWTKINEEITNPNTNDNNTNVATAAAAASAGPAGISQRPISSSRFPNVTKSQE